MKKRICSVVLMAVLVGVLYVSAKETGMFAQGEEVPVLGNKIHAVPVLLEEEDMITCAPVKLQDISAIYDAEIRQIPLALLQDVQQYVAEKDFDGALAAYGDESLLVDLETFKDICPEYNQVYAAYKHKYIIDNDEIMADFVYRVEMDGVEGEEFLVYYQPYAEGSIEVSYLRESRDGYRIEHHYSFGGSNGEFVLFRNEEESGNIYYKLMANDSNTDQVSALSLTRYEVREDENAGVYHMQTESRTIKELEVGIQPYVTYLDYKNQYAYDAKTYIENNLWMLLVCREYSRYWWGDEEDVISLYGDYWVEELKEALDNTYRDHGIVRADYDNDGEPEWFDRTGEFQNRLITVDDMGNYSVKMVYPGSFYGAYDAERMWFINLRDKIITFQLVNNGKQEWIEAYLVEEEVSIPLLTCQIGYTYEIGLSGTSEWWYSGVPLTEDWDILVAKDKDWFLKNCAQRVEDLRMDNSIEAYTGEIPYDEAFHKLLQEDGYRLIEGEAPQALPAYHIDTKTDTERFAAQLSEEEARLLSYKWAYLWYAEDGTENYLVYAYVSGNTDSYMLEWYQRTENGMEFKQRVDFGNYNGYADLLWYKGQLIYVAEMIPFGLGQTKGFNITVFEDDCSWSAYTLYYEAEEYEVISVYEEEGTGICNWMQENSQNLLQKIECREVSLFDWQEPELTVQESYIFKNLLGGYNTDLDKYLVADINHDGTNEYMVLGKYYVGDAIGTSYEGWKIYGGTEKAFKYLTLSALTHSSVPGMYNSLIDYAEFDTELCMLTVEVVHNSHDYLVRARVIKDGEIEQKGVWLFRAALKEEIFPVEY